ncbi:MAG: hypothetical protein HKN29_04555 [Rhodothermales bacterium]|nr:hypothetical protein [Rhodothermales bacterium]
MCATESGDYLQLRRPPGVLELWVSDKSTPEVVPVEFSAGHSMACWRSLDRIAVAVRTQTAGSTRVEFHRFDLRSGSWHEPTTLIGDRAESWTQANFDVATSEGRSVLVWMASPTTLRTTAWSEGEQVERELPFALTGIAQAPSIAFDGVETCLTFSSMVPPSGEGGTNRGVRHFCSESLTEPENSVWIETPEGWQVQDTELLIRASGAHALAIDLVHEHSLQARVDVHEIRNGRAVRLGSVARPKEVSSLVDLRLLEDGDRRLHILANGLSSGRFQTLFYSLGIGTKAPRFSPIGLSAESLSVGAVIGGRIRLVSLLWGLDSDGKVPEPGVYQLALM